MLYSFHTRCDDDHEIVQNRGTTNLVINTSTIEPNLSEDLANFCQYVQNGVVAATDDLTADLSSAVDEAILDEQWVSLVNRYDFDMVNAEYQGEQRGRIEEINNLVAEGILTPEQAAERIERIRHNETSRVGESCE